ncbi:MAG TPA: efflux RND transporter permease subunit [Elusimicrobiota bacterium]|nr:efflux RND transporter permease subunit [Elusimicrobiota bacterium]
MGAASFFVKRPVTTTMIYMGVVLIGGISWILMPRELFPSISFPQLTVVTRYGNAAPEEMENLITKVIEESVGTVPNLKRVRSISKEGVSLVTLEFNWGTDMGFAHLSAREKIDQIKDRLPNEADEPIIQRHNPFAHPIMIFSVTGEMNLAGLTDISKKVLKQRLEKVVGVASAAISGGAEREILVDIDRGRMDASKVSISAVVDALRTSNVNYPAGTTQGKFYEYLVRTMGEFKSIDEIGQTVILVEKPPEEYERKEMDATRSNRPKQQRLVHLGEIGVINDTFKETSSYSRYQGKENVSISIQKQADANTITTAKRVRAAMEELSGSLPKNVKVELVYDESIFITTAVNGVFTDGFTGSILAFIVLYFFLKSVGDALIVSVAIPMSALLIFVSMYFKGISINMLSLAGLGLAIGNLVDNSIVVVENTARLRSQGGDIVQGAIDSADEVGNSMVTSALTNVAVILPLLFAKGVAQQLFMDLFFASVGASIVSMLVSLTLIPRLAAHPVRIPEFLKFWKRRKDTEPDPVEEIPRMGEVRPAEGPSFWRPFKRAFVFFKNGLSDDSLDRIIAKYQTILSWVLDHSKKTMIIVFGLLIFSFVILAIHEKTFMPKFDQGQFMIRLDMPVGTRLEVTNRVMERIESVLAQVPGVKDVTANVGSSTSEAIEALGAHQGQSIINLEREKTKRSTEDVIADLKKLLDKTDLEGGEVQYILQDSILSTAFETSAPIVVEIKGPDLVTLKKISTDLTQELQNIRGIYGIKSSFALPSAETRVTIEKDRASAYQLSVSDIARTALIGIKGYIATTFKESGQEIDVRVQLRAEDRSQWDDIRRLTVKAPSGVMVPLAEVANLELARGPSEIKHLDQQRAILLTANVLKRSVADVILDVKKTLASYQHLSDYNITLTGESAQMKESFGGLSIAMIMSALLIYMIMAAEFESFGQPLLIMTTVPFCIVGVALTLFVTRIPLSAPVMLGTIILGGLVVNNGIILIDFMNQIREEGETDLRKVVMQGGSTRFRPIIMTMLVSVLGVLPMALGLSEGSELSSPMATITFGGLFISACLSLFFIPFLYYHFETWQLAHADETPEDTPPDSDEQTPEST